MRTRDQTKQQTNGNRAIWLAYRTDTNARGFSLVKGTLGWKNVMLENFLDINRYFLLTPYCNTIGQSTNAFSILGFSLARKWRCFDLFIHWLIKQVTNTYETIFSRSYENRSKDTVLFKYVQVDSLIELKEHEDLSLAEEAERNWIEVLDQTYLFDRRRREVGPVLTHIELSKTTETFRPVLRSKWSP